MICGVWPQVHRNWLEPCFALELWRDGFYKCFTATSIDLQCVHLPEDIPGLLPVTIAWLVQYVTSTV